MFCVFKREVLEGVSVYPARVQEWYKQNAAALYRERLRIEQEGIPGAHLSIHAAVVEEQRS